MVKGANSTSIRLRLLEAGLNETLVFKTLVTPCTFSVLQLAVRSTEQKGKSVEKWPCQWKRRDEVKCPHFCWVRWAARSRTPHLSYWPSSCHPLWIIFLSYSLKIILQICVYLLEIFKLVSVSTFQFSWGTWRSIENVLLKWRQD